MRKILYISGTRADYGLMRNTLYCIKNSSKLELEIAATGMHLMPEFGRTIKEIRKDKFKIHMIEEAYKKDDKFSMADFAGALIQKLTKKIMRIKPDIILLLGDRAEMLAGAVVGAYLALPVAHIHGGDISCTVDEMVRHAVTKLSHIHFAASKKSAERIIKMGEEEWRVFTVGAPGLDSIISDRIVSKDKIAKKYNINLNNPLLLVVQHPAGDDAKETKAQMKTTMEAIKKIGYQTIVIYPNADFGGRAMINVIENYRKVPSIQIYKNIPRLEYLSLMNIAGVLIGNSSSGIIESLSFKLPVINIGNRQEGRQRGSNVIDVDYNKEDIVKAVERILFNKKFRIKINKCSNPYKKGLAGENISNILGKIKIDNKLLSKKMAY